jgi:hypothetical protein
VSPATVRLSIQKVSGVGSVQSGGSFAGLATPDPRELVKLSSLATAVVR